MPAASSAVGSVLEDAGVEWRAAFVISIVRAWLAAGSGDAALFALAAFCGLGSVANLRPAAPPTR